MFTKHKRKSISEMRPVTEQDIESFLDSNGILYNEQGKEVSISQADRDNNSPNIGDWIARNPKNHGDSWLVAEAYYKDNLEPI